MALNKDQFKRIGIVHSLLLAYRRYTFNELLEKVNMQLEQGKSVSRRTLFSDLAYLKNLGAPLRNNKKESYYYTESFSLFDVFNPIEADYLKECVTMLRKVNKLSIAKELIPDLETLLLRIEAWDNGDEQIVFFDNNAEYQGKELIPIFFKKISKKVVLSISYVTFQKENFDFTFHPYLLKEYNQRWYVFGWDADNKEIKRFPLDRIRQIKELPLENYIENDFWDANQHFSEMVGISRSEGQRPENIRVRSFGLSSDYLLTKPLHHSQRLIEETDAYCTFEYHVIRNYEFESLLRSFGDGIVEV